MSYSIRNYFSGACLWALGAAIACSSATISSGLTITTSGVSGGNPGGQPLYVVSDLVEGDAFNLEWGGVDGLSVTGMLTVDELTNSHADLRVMLDADISGDNPRVTHFGVAIDGFSGISDTDTGGTYLDLADDGNFPGFSTDVCATSAANCAGGASGGIPDGGSDEFTLHVDGTFSGSIDLSEFGLKVQGGPGGNSFELAGVATEKIPEPTSIALLMLGIGLLVPLRKRA